VDKIACSDCEACAIVSRDFAHAIQPEAGPRGHRAVRSMREPPQGRDAHPTCVIPIERNPLFSVCVGYGAEASRICYEIATAGKNISQSANEAAFFHTRPLPPHPITPP